MRLELNWQLVIGMVLMLVFLAVKPAFRDRLKQRMFRYLKPEATKRQPSTANA